MIEGLDLTNREKELLKQALFSEQSEPVGQLFRRLGFRPFISLGIMIVALIGLLTAGAVWYQWLTEEGGLIWVLLALFVLDALLSPLRFRDEQARVRLIRKLFHSLEAREGQNFPGDRQLS